MFEEAGETKPPYEGWFPQIQGEKRQRLLEYIEQVKQREEEN